MRSHTKNINFTADLLSWAQGKIGAGYNNLSEVVRDALRFKREAERADYLNPPPFKPGVLAKAYRNQSKADQDLERKAGRASQRSAFKFKPEEA